MDNPFLTPQKKTFEVPDSSGGGSNPFLAPPQEPVANTFLGKTVNFLRGVGLNIPSISPAENTVPVGSAWLDVAKTIAQGFGQAAVKTGLGALLITDFKTYQGKENPNYVTWNVPQALQPILGADKIDNIGKSINDYQSSITASPFAQKTGLSKFAFPLAFAGVTINTGLDLSLFDGGPKGLVNNLVRETSEAKIVSTLMKIGVEENLARETAPILSQATKPEQVQDVLSNLNNLKDLETLNTRISEGDKKALSLTDTGLSTDLEPLAQEARKYKSADEFDYLYHSAFPKDLENIAQSGLQRQGERKGIYFDQSVKGALGFGKEGTPLLRIAKKLTPEVKGEGGTFDYFLSKKDIPPELIQISTDKGKTWKFIQDTNLYNNKAVGKNTSEAVNLAAERAKAGESFGNRPDRQSVADAMDRIGKQKNINTDQPASSIKTEHPDIDPITGNVTPPVARGGITPPDLNIRGWKDHGTFSFGRETFERNIRRVASPEDVIKLDKFAVEPIRANETARIDYTNNLKNEVRGVIDDLHIKAGGKEDKLIQLYGEKQISEDILKAEAPTKWQDIKEAAQFFRSKYDQLLNDVNASRQKFGYQPIPKRDDYFRHFFEIKNVINQIGILFREQDLPTEIAGISDIFKPGKPFSTAELKRNSLETTISAIKGMDNYIDTISKQIFHIDSVQRIRSLERYIRKTAEVHANSSEKVNLASFVQNLNEYGNLLAGKSAKLDRAVEGTIGRRVFSVANKVKAQTGVSLILGNISSALTNFIPFTESLATTDKIPAIKGLLESMITPFKGDIKSIEGVKSAFLTRRYPDGKIGPTNWDNIKDKAGWLFSTIDKFVSKSVVAGKYFEGLGKGLSPEEAMKAADKYGGQVLADRSFGQLPNHFNSKTASFLTQFQTEVNNQYSFLVRDIPELAKGNKAKITSALGQFIIYSYFFNDAFENVTGRRPALDPLYAGLTLLGQTDASKHLSGADRAVKAGKDVVGNLPFGNLIPGLGSGGRFPITAVNPFTSKLSEGDLTELLNPINLQLKKTVQGLSAYNKGQVRTPSGKTRRYKINQDVGNFFRTGLFGPSSAREAKTYYDGLNQSKSKESNPFLQ